MANGHGGPRSSNMIGVGQVPRGQPYGTATAQSQALAAVPLTGAAPPSPRQPSPGAQQEMVPGIQPGQIPSLEDPSVRPDEPVTEGLPLGPGAGPEALGGLAPQAPEEVRVLRTLYGKYKNADIRRLLQWSESQL